MITISTKIQGPMEKVWEYWTIPKHIKHWYYASEDWYVPAATNDLQVGGAFSTTMSAKDGSFSFDFSGVYTHIEVGKLIEYTLDDARKVRINFSKDGEQILVVQEFEPENENSHEMQKTGWQAILDHFKKYVEQLG